MKVWRWTSRIGEDGSLTYSNHRHSQVTVISICISEYDGERVTVKIKVDRRKQLFLGRALMKVWRWTSRIGEDGSLTYSNHRHSQVTVISICISEYDGERVTVKIKVDRRKQLFLGRALMKVWRWTSRICEDRSMTYSNFLFQRIKPFKRLPDTDKHSSMFWQPEKIKIRNRFLLRKNYLKNIQPSTLSPSTIKAFSAISASGESL